MLSRIEIKNYRSFLDAKADLKPFTLIIGANGSGKSNFLRLFRDLSSSPNQEAECFADNGKKYVRVYEVYPAIVKQTHFNHPNEPQIICIQDVTGNIIIKIDKGRGISRKAQYKSQSTTEQLKLAFKQLKIGWFNLNAASVEQPEQIKVGEEIEPNGRGIISILDDLKTGDREDLFDEIEQNLIRYIPSIEKLSLRISESGKKSLQVREKGIEKPFPVAELSEGTKLILIILTILYQENPPKLILLEDIDRGLHPRLFQKVIEMLRDIVKTKEVQIIATTHNPYLVDEFTGEEESVLIVEKQDTVSTITSLAERLDNGDTAEEALGSLWFSGFFATNKED
jgi:predicted ATPase